MQTVDTIVIGAGIAGASVAWQLVQSGTAGQGVSVLLLERESQPGYHTTGRSAALYMATYGTPNIQALTRASRAFYDAPPAEFGADPILSPRGVVYVAGPDQLDLLKQAYDEALATSPNVQWVEQADLLAMLPCLKPEAVAAGMSEPEAADIDVNALHQGYLRGLRQRGGQVLTHAEVTAVRREGTVWQVTLADGRLFAAPTIVNAAGAWADGVAGLAGGFMGGIGGFTGVVPTLWCTLRGMAKDEQRAIIQNFNLAALAFTMLGYLVSGAVTRDMWPLLPVVAVALLVPVLLGSRLYVGLSEAAFRQVVLTLLSLSGLAMLVAAVPRLIGAP